MFETYADLGKFLHGSWGIKWKENNLDKHLEAMTKETKIICLLAAIISELKTTKQTKHPLARRVCWGVIPKGSDCPIIPDWAISTILRRNGIHYAYHLVKMTRKQLLQLPGIGPIRADYIELSFAWYGLMLKDGNE